MIRELARAKVNLTLAAKGRLTEGRFAGYHALESLVVFPEIGDVIEVDHAEALTLTIRGPEARTLQALASDDNLIMRAANRLQDVTGCRAQATLHLTKNLPTASGIGGGTADAAATLRALTRLWKLDIDIEGLERLSLDLGADGPVTVRSKPVLMSGVGETLCPLEALPQFWMVLVNPRQPVATSKVFAALQAPPLQAAPEIVAPEVASLESLVLYMQGHPNEMEPAATKLVPEIGTVLAGLRRQDGCLIARMSGSGATCFGVFAQEQDASLAAQGMAFLHPDFWIGQGKVDGAS